MSEQELRVNAMLVGQREATAQAVMSVIERCGALAAELAATQVKLEVANAEIEKLKAKPKKA